MKKILSIIIALCLIFASIVPIYAEAWTSQEADLVTNNTSTIKTYIQTISTILSNFWETSAGSVAPSVLYSWQDFMYEFWRLSEFLIPRGSYQGQTNLWSIIEGTLPNILTYVSSWMSNNTSLLTTISSYENKITNAVGNMSLWENWNVYQNAHNSLFDHTTGWNNDWYHFGLITYPGQINHLNPLGWTQGTPVGNIARMFQIYNDNFINSYKHNWDATLTDYTGQLGIWDSQGETLTQEGWSPTSAINGLYKYLAYTQRDVARLTYVLASDEEIATREKARETQTAVMDDFIDPEGTAAASTANFGEIASGSANVQQNFSTGYSISNMWSAFGSEHYGWFSQECADALDTSAASSSGNRLLKNDKHNEPDYDTPLLNEYYKQILSLGGGNDD